MGRDDLSWFLQEEAAKELERLGQEQWLTVYGRTDSDNETASRFCALVPLDGIERALTHDSWDFSIGDGAPGLSSSLRTDPPEVTYHRYGRDDALEPLVLRRSFNGIRPKTTELSEEFRLFHGLYHDRHNDRFIAFDDSGEEEVVAAFQDGNLRVKSRRIRQFLAVKKMALLSFFEFTRFSDLPRGSRCG